VTGVDTVDLVLALALLVACYTDLDRGLIPNAVTLPLVAAGVMLHALNGDPAVGLLGMGIGFALHYMLWFLGVVKGGDAKLMIGVGAVLGWQGLIEATLWEFVLFLPLGITLLAVRGRLRAFGAHLRWLALKARGVDLPAPTAVTYVVYAPIITGAVVAARLTDWFDLFGSGS